VTLSLAEHVDIKADRALKLKGVSLDDTVSQLHAKQPGSLSLLLDGAWHKAPTWEKSPGGPAQGLLAMKKLPPGCVYLAACQPAAVALPPPKTPKGSTGARHGHFTDALLQHLLLPGRDMAAGIAAAGDAVRAVTGGRQTMYVENTLAAGAAEHLVLLSTDPEDAAALLHHLTADEEAVVALAIEEGRASLADAEKARDVAAATRVLAATLQALKASPDAKTSEGAIAAAVAATLVPAACMAVGRIAAAAPLTDGYADKKKGAGALPAVADAMRSLPKSREVQLNAAWAINHLLSGAPAAHRPAALACGAIEALLCGLAAYGGANAPLASSGCEALAQLIADSPGALSQCATVNSLETCVKVLNAWASSDGQATAAACGVLAAMMRSDSGNMQEAALNAGIAPATVSAAKPSNPCGRVPQGCAAALRLLRVLAMKPGRGREAIAAASGLEVALDAVRVHGDAPDVLEAGLWVVCLITSPVSGRMPTASEAEVQALLTQATALLSGPPRSPTVQALACRLIRNVTWDPTGGAEPESNEDGGGGIFGAISEFVTKSKATAAAAVIAAKEAAEARRAAAVSAGVPDALRGMADANGKCRPRNVFVATEAQAALDSVIPPPALPPRSAAAPPRAPTPAGPVATYAATPEPAEEVEIEGPDRNAEVAAVPSGEEEHGPEVAVAPAEPSAVETTSVPPSQSPYDAMTEHGTGVEEDATVVDETEEEYEEDEEEEDEEGGVEDASYVSSHPQRR
jgi:hypothetical protein